jgi:hypothetical protein
MPMIPPERESRPEAHGARSAQPGGLGDPSAAQAGLDAVDTVREIATSAGSKAARVLLAEARRGICAGDQIGIIWIVAAQQLEHEGRLSPRAASYLVACFAEDMTVAMWDSDPEMSALTARIERLERANGLRPGEYWRVDEGPPEWRAAERLWEAAFDRRWQAILRRFGEHEMAELLERDRDEFDRRLHAGEMALFGG